MTRRKEALAAIVGLGKSTISRSPVGSARALASMAVREAMADAHLRSWDIDGLLINQSALAPSGTLPLQIMDDIGLSDLRLLSIVECKGASALQMIQQATMAIRHGMATTVACVFADTPVGEGKGSGQSFQNESPMTGIPGWEAQFGMFGPVGAYALEAKRYMHRFDIDELQLGAYAMTCRKWSALNPDALLRKPLTTEEYLSSRYIAEPLRLFDCAYPANGSIAVIVSAIERAGDLRQPPVYIHGMGQGHQTVGRLKAKGDEFQTAGSAAAAGAYQMAKIKASEISICQFYDAFSYCAIAALEDYGLCSRGEGAHFIASGATSPQGNLPINTGGGQLASYYLQGMTPVAEAVIQGRGQAGSRQVVKNDIVLVNGSGGRLEYHAAVVLSPHCQLG